MAFPFFYITQVIDSQKNVFLDEETSKHILRVLRMSIGERVHLTDGKGNRYLAQVSGDHKKKCEVEIVDKTYLPREGARVSIGISLVKNNSRFEWFLEKATELGIESIFPLICTRTEKQKYRMERMQGILISAMLQSQQCWIPSLSEPIAFDKLAVQANDEEKFIAHCLEDKKAKLTEAMVAPGSSKIILIGPEGDFTKKEIDLAITNSFITVSLGDTRLRTETAGMAAAVMMKLGLAGC